MPNGKEKMNRTETISKPGRLLRAALKAANAVPLEELRDKTKLRISWLRKFRAGLIPDPSVNKVEKVYTALTGNKLL